MGKKITKKILLASCLAIREVIYFTSKSPDYNYIRRVRRSGIKVFRSKGGRYFLELNWRKKLNKLEVDKQ